MAPLGVDKRRCRPAITGVLVVNPAVEALRADLDAADRLRLSFSARNVDREFLDRPGARIIYAVDSSVLNSQFAPESGPNRHFSVFQGPPKEEDLRLALERAQSRVGSVVVSYLIERLARDADGRQLLLLLPGHDSEFSGLYDRLAEEFARQAEVFDGAKARIQELDLYRRARARASLADNDAERDKLAAELYSVLYAIEGPHQKLHRLNDLSYRDVLVKTSAAANHPALQDEAFRVGGRSVFDAADHGAGATRWEQRLEGAVAGVFLPNDALALAELERLNIALQSRGVRVVLFTTNSRLLEIGELHHPFAKDGNEPHRACSFTELFLRHPQCLLDEPHLSRPAEASIPRAATDTNDDWVEALLDFRLSDELEPSQRRSLSKSGEREIGDDELERALARRPDLHTTFVRKWTRYLDQLTIEHSTVSDLAKRNISELLRRVEQPGETLSLSKAVQDRVSKLTIDSWSDFFKTVARTGLELVQTATTSDHPIVYAVPLLVMLGGERRRNTLSGLWNVTEVRTAPQRLMDAITSLNQKANLRDSYAQTMAYGILFAYMGRWKITRLLAQRAIATAEIIKNRPDENDTETPEEAVDGREAHYLYAMSLRVTGHLGADLEPALAEVAYARELADKDPRTDLKPELTGIRFGAEEIAIKSAILFADPASLDRREAIDALRDQIPSLIDAAPKCAEQLVCAHARAMLRSEYFFLTGLLFEAQPDADGRAKVVAGASVIGGMIEAQLDDLTLLYQQSRWLPFRARGVLRLACALSGRWDLAPLEWREPYSDTLKRFPAAVGDVLRPIERRRLDRIEAMIEAVEEFRDRS